MSPSARRFAKLLVIAAVAVGAAYFIAPSALEQWRPGAREPSKFRPPAPRSELAPVHLWFATSSGTPEYWRDHRLVPVAVRAGAVFVHDELVPREKLRALLDDKVQAGMLDGVAVMPADDARWADIIATVDECRKSRVAFVLLNRHTQ